MKKDVKRMAFFPNLKILLFIIVFAIIIYFLFQFCKKFFLGYWEEYQ